VHFYLIVFGIGIHEAKEFMTRCCLNKLVNTWEYIIVLQESFVEVSKVNTHSPLPILFLHMDGISMPVWVECLSDEASLK